MRARERGIGLCFLTQHGRFLARISGPVSGNVLLRTAQYRLADTKDDALPIAKMFLTGKIFNGRWSLERTLRDHALRVDVERLKGVIGQMKQALADLMSAGSVEELMGIEGVAAKAYFSVFDQMILKNPAYFRFDGRSRRPPMDPVNALLSFTYSILGHEIAGALEAVGLDPAVGFLHALRPGRASLGAGSARGATSTACRSLRSIAHQPGYHHRTRLCAKGKRRVLSDR